MNVQEKEVAMPFKSEKQRRYMWMKHPKIAKRWAEEEKVKEKKSFVKASRRKKKHGSSD